MMIDISGGLATPWALVVVTIDVLIIWALTAHGSEMRKA